MKFPDQKDLTILDDPSETTATSEHDVEILTDTAAQMLGGREYMLGFPVNLDFDYRQLSEFLAVHGNNVGDPRKESEYHFHTKPFELAVIDFFARLAGCPDAFGYVTNGGTEGNLFGCYLGRERFPDAVMYYSAAAHYSMMKIARLLRVEARSVACLADQTMDLDNLTELHRRHGDGRAALVVATIGTTTGGAYDDIAGVRAALNTLGTTNIHIHSDAAFGGLLAALGPTPRPWAFESGADTVAISGHKMIGGPIPSGIVLAHRRDVEKIRKTDVAVGSDDDTINGSRDAFTPALLWYELRRLGRTGLRRRVQHCLDTARYAENRLRGEGRNPVRPPGSNTVVFDAPSAEVCQRWNLLTVDERAHLVTMPHVTEEHIDRLCAEIRR
ncbi:histidine decarboxylase [Nocardia goodfellowii]|uniref:Histidine decarboxylase n=1 Tax=Nocardia goodfellowii TaxID=882446 RepID=A0ABS4QIR0_9NOCA|nr:histidine decarboxylase [Nocardia goodfellowii]MBP2191580.1 histidine decarboxylase [Nocardia goodfellowii]